MPPSKRAPETRPAGPDHATPETTTAETIAPGVAPTAEPAAPGGTAEPHELRLQLPFLTLTVSRRAHEHHPAREPGAGKPAAARPATGKSAPPAAETQSGERLLFYAGVAALGVAGVVEWPVAAAIAAGTWIASRARSGGGRTDVRPALPAGTTPAGTTPAGTTPPPAGSVTTPAGSVTTPAP